MKLGNVVKVIPSQNWQKHVVVLLDWPSVILQNKFPEKKHVSRDEIGFIVSVPDDKETMFDWLIEVAFPDSNLQGWVQKTDLALISP